MLLLPRDVVCELSYKITDLAQVVVLLEAVGGITAPYDISNTIRECIGAILINSNPSIGYNIGTPLNFPNLHRFDLPLQIYSETTLYLLAGHRSLLRFYLKFVDESIPGHVITRFLQLYLSGKFVLENEEYEKRVDLSKIRIKLEPIGNKSMVISGINVYTELYKTGFVDHDILLQILEFLHTIHGANQIWNRVGSTPVLPSFSKKLHQVITPKELRIIAEEMRNSKLNYTLVYASDVFHPHDVRSALQLHIYDRDDELDVELLAALEFFISRYTVFLVMLGPCQWESIDVVFVVTPNISLSDIRVALPNVRNFQILVHSVDQAIKLRTEAERLGIEISLIRMYRSPPIPGVETQELPITRYLPALEF